VRVRVPGVGHEGEFFGEAHGLGESWRNEAGVSLDIRQLNRGGPRVKLGSPAEAKPRR